jgi:predicted house-cleaning noncanonical NTP pyrophosphatase (MazG superfamily)
MAKPIKMPLTPATHLIFVSGSKVTNLTADEITADKVGLKAYGLSSIPPVWTLPFIVISGEAPATAKAVSDALLEVKIKNSAKVIVRSSGVSESIDTRGSLDSCESTTDKILFTIQELSSKIGLSHPEMDMINIHWIVQLLAPFQLKGHLSNERRLSEALRDWVAEAEATAHTPPETHRIPIRKWRDARTLEIKKLEYAYKTNYLDGLRDIAHWAHARAIRVHFEWVWDGSNVYVVQADECEETTNGVDPTQLTTSQALTELTFNPEAFRIATEDDYKNYVKLANAKLYREIGYTAISFYVLDLKEELELIIKTGQCSSRLKSDLEHLTVRPLVIRTDGLKIPSAQKQMLPRSNELRSTEAALEWLMITFKEKINELNLADSELCLIAHHFIPASASAWSQAHPDKRRVRIESLWGLPEGLYWYAHDVFDVDTNYRSTKNVQKTPANMSIRERLRYKGRFVAPNEDGEWIVHNTAAGYDWKRSIKRKDWIEEIAWSSRKIAENLGKSVVIMWFVDIPKTTMKHAVIPWYHEEWKHEGTLPKAAPRKKVASSEEVTLRTKSDWHNLNSMCAEGRNIARVLIEPIEPDLVRNQQFAKDLAELAHKFGFVVELSGGVLSHAYYMLTSSGCRVECADLYATEEGELEFNKLVRDKIPDTINARGEEVKLLKLEGEALILALKRKIVEEALEVLDAKTSMDIIEEMADLRETASALAKVLGITDKDIEEVRKEKKLKRGAFEDGLMLEKTALASSLSQMQSVDDDPFALSLPHIEKTISQPEQLPYYPHDIHSDKRYDSQGIFERQFSLSLPAHGENFRPPRVHFTLESPDKNKHEYILDLHMDRTGSDLRCKIRIINAPTQMAIKF